MKSNIIDIDGAVEAETEKGRPFPRWRQSQGRVAGPQPDLNQRDRHWRNRDRDAAGMAGHGKGADLMNLKAQMGHWSSVVGGGVQLLAEDGRMIGQVAFVCYTDDLRDKDVQMRLSRIICEAINAPHKGIAE